LSRRDPKVRQNWPLNVALVAIAGVWLAGCTWSYREQTRFATAQAFAHPALLPLIVDGLAIACAAIAYGISLEGRSALGARCGMLLAIAASGASNGVYAWERTKAAHHGHGDWTTVVIASGVPVFAMLSFEILLSELRRRALFARGVPVPVAVPRLRAIRLALAPTSTWSTWRRVVLARTAIPVDGVGIPLPDLPPAADMEHPPVTARAFVETVEDAEVEPQLALDPGSDAGVRTIDSSPAAVCRWIRAQVDAGRDLSEPGFTKAIADRFGVSTKTAENRKADVRTGRDLRRESAG
jgi:hypothetical protein